MVRSGRDALSVRKGGRRSYLGMWLKLKGRGQPQQEKDSQKFYLVEGGGTFSFVYLRLYSGTHSRGGIGNFFYKQSENRILEGRRDVEEKTFSHAESHKKGGCPVGE